MAIRKVVFKKEYLERKRIKLKADKTITSTANVASSLLNLVDIVSTGKAGKAARLLQELMRLFKKDTK